MGGDITQQSVYRSGQCSAGGGIVIAKSEAILAQLSSVNKDSMFADLFERSRPDDESWMDANSKHLLGIFKTADQSLCKSPHANLIFIMEEDYFKHIPSSLLDKYFTYKICLQCKMSADGITGNGGHRRMKQN